MGLENYPRIMSLGINLKLKHLLDLAEMYSRHNRT